MRKLMLFFIVFISCENDPLMDGMFTSNIWEGQYLKFLGSNKATLILPNNTRCFNDFNQIELNVEKIDKNAIRLKYSNKDLEKSDINDLFTYCIGDIPLLKRFKWEESYEFKNELENAFANLHVNFLHKNNFSGHSLDEIKLYNPLKTNLNSNSIFIKDPILFSSLWNLFYRTGYDGNPIYFFKLINSNPKAIKGLFDYGIKQKELKKYLDNENDFQKYSNISIEEFKTMLDIGYVSVINEDYVNAIKITKEINYITEKLIDKILIVNNFEKQITIGEGNKVFFNRLKSK